MPSEIKLRKGQYVIKSYRGERGFYYPTLDKKVAIREDCIGLRMTGYLESNNKTAYSIPTNAVKIEDQYDPDIPYMVIWK
jgi:hypothetical protein